MPACQSSRLAAVTALGATGGSVLSAALMLRYSLEMETEATAVEAAVDAVLTGGYRTRDLAKPGEESLTTVEMTKVIVEHINN